MLLTSSRMRQSASSATACRKSHSLRRESAKPRSLRRSRAGCAGRGCPAPRARARRRASGPRPCRAAAADRAGSCRRLRSSTGDPRSTQARCARRGSSAARDNRGRVAALPIDSETPCITIGIMLAHADQIMQRLAAWQRDSSRSGLRTNQPRGAPRGSSRSVRPADRVRTPAPGKCACQMSAARKAFRTPAPR